MANMASACALVLSNDFKSSSFGPPLMSWRRTKAAASTCIIVSIVCVCVCVLVTCGVLLLREYSLASAYEKTTCTIREVRYTRHLPCQYCPERNKAKDRGVNHGCVQLQFPCMQTMTSYTVGSITYTAVLKPDSIHAAGRYSECSYYTCLKDLEHTARAIDVVADKWRGRRGEIIPCYYNTALQDDVIEQKMYTLSDVIHSMLWPSLVIIVCCVVFLVLETRRRKLTFCGVRKTDELESSADSTTLRMHTTEETPEHVANAEGSARTSAPPHYDTCVLLRGGVEGGIGGGAHGGGGARTGAWKDTRVRDDFIVCKVLNRSALDRVGKKAWKSYSSLEHLITAKNSSSSGHGGTNGKEVEDEVRQTGGHLSAKNCRSAGHSRTNSREVEEEMDQTSGPVAKGESGVTRAVSGGVKSSSLYRLGDVVEEGEWVLGAAGSSHHLRGHALLHPAHSYCLGERSTELGRQGRPIEQHRNSLV